MTDRFDLIHRANEREWQIIDRHDQPLGRGKLAGAALDFPVAHAPNGLAVEVSWALVERLATGTSTRVLI